MWAGLRPAPPPSQRLLLPSPPPPLQAHQPGASLVPLLILGLLSLQKISAFNQDITALVQGEEVVGEKDSRLFTKLRKEFSSWNTVIEDNFKEGEWSLRS